jgi:competence protein ComEA
MDDMELSAVSRGRAVAGALLLIVALVLAGRYLAAAGAADQPTRSPATAAGELRAEPRPRLVVHVVGAVRRPGLYRLADGARIADALRRAGGATRRADVSLVNLAAPVSDGTQIVVPRRAPVAAAPTGAGEPGTTASGPLHLNTATVEQLDELPGVGPVTAEKIVEYREQHGAFSSVEDLDAIPGIGPARLEQLRELVAP